VVTGLLAGAPLPTLARSSTPETLALNQLPKQAQDTYELIRRGGPRTAAAAPGARVLP
jgi:guanyl-specific ribonuclease Sa